MYKEFFQKHGWRYLPGVVFIVLSSYIGTLSPRALGNVIDALSAAPIDRDAVVYHTVSIVIIAVAVFITRFIWRYFIIGNSLHLERFLREKFFAHLQRQSANFFNHEKTGNLLAYAINDIGAIRNTFGNSISMVVGGITTAFSVVMAMAGGINSQLTIYVLLPIPIIIVVTYYLGRFIRRRFRRVQEIFALTSDRVNENINGIRVIKAYAQEDEECDKFEVINQDMRKAQARMVRVSSLMNPTIQFMFGISFLIALIVGSNLVREGTMSVGEFVAFNTYLGMIIRPVLSIGRIINTLQRGMASIKRLEALMMIRPEVVDGTCDHTVQPVQGEIEIKNLTFNYPDIEEPALSNISLHVQKGQILGIIGHTGSGKTTLVNLLLKQYNVPDGTIFFDGEDINHFPLDTLRENIGYVPQDNFLFSSTVGENIRFFNPRYSQEQIELAAQQSRIYDNIIDFPRKFETVVGERGVTLSGGQKQRISIARALIKQPSLLILDDSLSAVDTRTEDEILTNLQTVLQNKTGIIIAHRISAVQHADIIVVLDHGQIVERGTHAELLELDGHYAQIYHEQLEQDAKKEASAL